MALGVCGCCPGNGGTGWLPATELRWPVGPGRRAAGCPCPASTAPPDPSRAPCPCGMVVRAGPAWAPGRARLTPYCEAAGDGAEGAVRVPHRPSPQSQELMAHAQSTWPGATMGGRRGHLHPTADRVGPQDTQPPCRGLYSPQPVETLLHPPQGPAEGLSQPPRHLGGPTQSPAGRRAPCGRSALPGPSCPWLRQRLKRHSDRQCPALGWVLAWPLRAAGPLARLNTASVRRRQGLPRPPLRWPRPWLSRADWGHSGSGPTGWIPDPPTGEGEVTNALSTAALRPHHSASGRPVAACRDPRPTSHVPACRSAPAWLRATDALRPWARPSSSCPPCRGPTGMAWLAQEPTRPRHPPSRLA